MHCATRPPGSSGRAGRLDQRKLEVRDHKTQTVRRVGWLAVSGGRLFRAAMTAEACAWAREAGRCRRLLCSAEAAEEAGLGFKEDATAAPSESPADPAAAPEAPETAEAAEAETSAEATEPAKSVFLAGRAA